MALPRVNAHDSGVVFRAKFNDGTLVGISRPSKAEETAFVQELLGWPLELRVALPRVNTHESGVVFRADFNDSTLIAI